jgi:hypothetical protein
LSEFRQYLLTEETVHLAQKVGDLLTALQSLKTDAGNMGGRHMASTTQAIVDQMRRVLSTRWLPEERRHLVVLQRAAVALAKAVDTGDQLPETVAGATVELEKLVAAMGQPVNRMASNASPTAPTATDRPAGTV